VGYLPGAHGPDCPVFARILNLAPPWARVAGLSPSPC
jgi:DNA-3-methyladenine glycosylase I